MKAVQRFLFLGNLALSAAVWDYSLRAIYIDNSTASLTSVDSRGNFKIICTIATDLPSGKQSSSFGTWLADGTIRWAVSDTLYAITPGKGSCSTSKVTLPFLVAGLSPFGENSTVLVLLSNGSIHTWKAGDTHLPKLAQLSTTLAHPVSMYDYAVKVLWVITDSNQLLRVSLPAIGAPSVQNVSLQCNPLVGLYLGDSEHTFYGWGQDPKSQYLTLYGIDSTSLADAAMKCNAVITTGGEGKFVSGDYDGQDSVAALATDALYIVSYLNNRPDDLHIPVGGGFTPSKFAAIMYQQFATQASSFIV